MCLLCRVFVVLLLFVGLSLAQVIKEIRIEGTQYVPEDVVLGLINIKSGSLYSQDLVRESIRRMYRSGFFDEVAVYEERQGDQVVLIYKVKDLPVIYKIEFQGNKSPQGRRYPLGKSLASLPFLHPLRPPPLFRNLPLYHP